MLIELSGRSIKAIILPVFLPLVRFSPSSLTVPLLRVHLFLPKSPSCLFRTAVLAKKDRSPFKILPLPERKLFSIRSRPTTISLSSFRKRWFFFYPAATNTTLRKRERRQKSMEGAGESLGCESSTSSGEIPFHRRLSLTNATQVRLFNAASVRSEAFSSRRMRRLTQSRHQQQEIAFHCSETVFAPKVRYPPLRIPHSFRQLPFLAPTLLFAMRYEWQLHLGM